MNNNQLVYGGFIAIIASIVAAIYFGCASSTDKRTNYPAWLETTRDAVVPPTLPSNVWTSDATKSNKRPDYLGTGPSYNLSQTQRGLTAAWIESKVGSGSSNSFTSQDGNGITSIVVRDVNGEDKEFPIMDFFEKIHGDIKLGFTRAQDYTDEKMGEVAVDAENALNDVKAYFQGLLATEVQQRQGADQLNRTQVNTELAGKVTKGANYNMKFIGSRGGFAGIDFLDNVKSNYNATMAATIQIVS